MFCKMLKEKLALLLLFFIIITITSCSQQNRQETYQGYIEGRFTYISPNIAGVLQALYVKRGDVVKPGDRLFLLEGRPESDTIRETEANLAQAKSQRKKTLAELEFVDVTHQRYSKLIAKNAVSKAEYDKTKTDLNQIKAQLISDEQKIKALEAELAQAKWAFEKKAVVAEKHAFVYDIFQLVGEYIPISRPVLSLITPEDIRVVFFLPQPYLSSVEIGQEVKINCDGCDSTITGKIEFISPKAEYTPPVIYSEKERAKLVYRIEAIPASNQINKLHPGQPVEITIVPKNKKLSLLFLKKFMHV